MQNRSSVSPSVDCFREIVAHAHQLLKTLYEAGLISDNPPVGFSRESMDRRQFTVGIHLVQLHDALKQHSAEKSHRFAVCGWADSWSLLELLNDLDSTISAIISHLGVHVSINEKSKFFQSEGSLSPIPSELALQLERIVKQLLGCTPFAEAPKPSQPQDKFLTQKDHLTSKKVSVDWNEVASDTGTPVHNQDFTEVNWYGTKYSFALGVQSSAIKTLWGEWEKTGLGLNQQTIRQSIDTERDRFRLSDVFKGHPAWETMIQGYGRGNFRLVKPPSHKKTSKKHRKNTFDTR